jgi:hypothetical protein
MQVASNAHLDDQLLSQIHSNMGQVYMDRQKWRKAATYFVLCKQTDMLCECLFQMGDFATLGELQSHLPDESPVHTQLAQSYEIVGMCKEAVHCYVKVCF